MSPFSLDCVHIRVHGDFKPEVLIILAGVLHPPPAGGMPIKVPPTPWKCFGIISLLKNVYTKGCSYLPFPQQSTQTASRETLSKRLHQGP